MAGEITKVVDNNKYFDYFKRPGDIDLGVYLKVYEAFCNAYKLEITNDDLDKFSRQVTKHILGRFRPEGVDYSPTFGKARLYVIIPTGKNYVRFLTKSNDFYKGQDSTFVELATTYMKDLKESKTLEEKVNK